MKYIVRTTWDIHQVAIQPGEDVLRHVFCVNGGIPKAGKEVGDS